MGSLLAYLVSMALRITEIQRALKPTGSFYLHCDPTASHYLKLVLDAIFVASSPSILNRRIEPFELDARILQREAPVNTRLVAIASPFPRA